MIIRVNNKEYSFDGYVIPINSVQRLAEKMYHQGRADAIDEAIKYFEEHAKEVYNHISARDFICGRLEQLKEQKE